MLYIISTVEAYIMEDEGDNKYLQMDETMKKLFTLKEKRPIIDFLNAAYGDDLSYEAEINYNNTEIINTKSFTSTYMTFHADMFITAVEGDKKLEYALEFQTKFDEEILIRMFRYSFERAAKLVYFKDKNKLRLKLPEPYLIMLEKEKGMDNEIMLEIEIPKALLINFKVKVLKYWDYDLERLYKENMYLLYPLQIFKLRKDMERIKNSKRSRAFIEKEMNLLNIKLLESITKTYIAIEKAYEDGKIEVTNYDEMTTVIINLKSYLLNKYDLKDDVDKEVKIMFKGFYDPKVEAIVMEKGIEKGIKLVAEKMIKDDNPIEKIKMYTGLSDEQINELRKLIETKGEH